MSFTGFPRDGVAWFQALALAQNREWFQANRAAWETLWLEPTRALLDELQQPLRAVYKRPLGPAKIFRLNRDVRFSKDKSPYKTHMAGLIPFEGAGPMEGPAAFYFHLGLEDLVAFGFYTLEGPALKQLRTALLDDKRGAALQKHVDVATDSGLEITSIQQLKRVPPGVDPAHPRAALLKNKGLAVSTSRIPSKVRHRADFKDWVLAQAKLAAPILKWGFDQKLG